MDEKLIPKIDFDDEWLDENKLFPTKEELLKSL